MKNLTLHIMILTLALPFANTSQAQGTIADKYQEKKAAKANQAKIDQLRNSARAHEQQAKAYDAKAQRYEDATKATPAPAPAAISKFNSDAKSLRDMAAEQRRLAKEKTAEADRLEKAQR